jgi:hypothetical protein
MEHNEHKRAEFTGGEVTELEPRITPLVVIAIIAVLIGLYPAY